MRIKRPQEAMISRWRLLQLMRAFLPLTKRASFFLLSTVVR